MVLLPQSVLFPLVVVLLAFATVTLTLLGPCRGRPSFLRIGKNFCF